MLGGGGNSATSLQVKPAAPAGGTPNRRSSAGPVRRRSRPGSPPGAALIAAVAVSIVAAFNLNIPYFAITPGPAIDVVELIDISSVETDSVSGRLMLTTVSLKKIRVAEAIRSWFDESYEVLSRSAIVPPGESDSEAEQRSVLQMRQSHENAAAAALAHLGYQVKVTHLGVRVSDFDTQAPAREVLRRGDIIVRADAAVVQRREDLNEVVSNHRIGDQVVLEVVRGDETLTLETTTVEREGEPRIGVFLDAVPSVELPVAIDIDSRQIGGPSAGLMYALGIVDLLDSSDLARQRAIAGTGEITLEGEVLPVGGIRQKLAGAADQGAEIFLIPAAEHEQACALASGDLDVYAVSDLRDAVRILSDPGYATERSCP